MEICIVKRVELIKTGRSDKKRVVYPENVLT